MGTKTNQLPARKTPKDAKLIFKTIREMSGDFVPPLAYKASAILALTIPRFFLIE
jgi:hypothetical protein